MAEIEPQHRERVTEIVTSWMEKGIEQGLERGIEQGIERGMAEGRRQEACYLVLRQLRKRFAALDEESQQHVARLNVSQLEDLGEALIEFTTTGELTDWLTGQKFEDSDNP